MNEKQIFKQEIVHTRLLTKLDQPKLPFSQKKYFLYCPSKFLWRKTELNKTGLQPVTRPLEQPLLGFKTAEEKKMFAKSQKKSFGPASEWRCKADLKKWRGEF